MARSNRLIAQFKPDSYQLHLDLDKQKKLFKGSLTVKGARRSKPSYRITLNQSGLKITSAKLYKLDKKTREELKIVRIVHHHRLQEVRLHTESQLASTNYELEIEYTGKVSTKGTNGFYTSTWLDDASEQQEILTTQFEPHYARQLLPCIDEPEAKATFELTLNLKSTDRKDQVLFNTEVESDRSTEAGREVKFVKTPIMSTNLLALVVGDLQAKSAKSRNGTTVSVYTTPNKLQSTSFALDFAIKTLELLEEKFKTPYPLTKLDLVAVPDFDAGAMENWGLVTFREELLLFDEQSSTLADKQSIALVVAHELAHQWFGNLVTMKWWDELWLNEGFANFMEYYLVDQIFPEWKMLEHYLITEKTYAIRLDSLPSSRPIVNKVNSPHQAVDAFDAIAYEKSGSVIRMVFNLLGQENFMRGLKDYFEKFSYKSASSVDLLGCWQSYTKLNLKAFTKTWLNEPGLPKIDVSIGKNSQQLVLEQSRFLSEPVSKLNLAKAQESALKSKPNIQKKQREFYENELKNRLSKTNQTLWQIPVSFVYQDDSPTTILIKKSLHSVQFNKSAKLPLKLNKGGESLYVTNYPAEFLNNLSESLKSDKLSVSDTLNVLSDTILLNRVGQFKPGAGAILGLISSTTNTVRNAQFWGLTGGFIGFLHYHLKQTGQTKLLNQYVSQVTGSALKNVGFEASKKDQSDDISTRFELLSLATLTKDPVYTPLLENMFEQSKSILDLESEKRLLSLYVIAKRGKKKDYTELFKQYQDNLGDAGIRDDLTYALCMFEKEDLVKSNLELMQNPNLVKEQDILAWLSQLTSLGGEAKEVILRWVLKDGGWEWLSQNLSPSDRSSAVKIILSSAFTTKDLNMLKKFFEELDNVEIEKALNESLDMAKSRISWHKKELPKLVEYLSDYRGQSDKK